MLGDLGRDHGNLNDFLGPVHPSPNQMGPTIWTDLHSMLHPLGRRHSHPSEAVAPHVITALPTQGNRVFSPTIALGRFQTVAKLGETDSPLGAGVFSPRFVLEEDPTANHLRPV